MSAIGVLIFAGLTAYDTQRLKNTYDFVAGDQVAAGRASIIGALQLYLDFINLFMFLLQFMGTTATDGSGHERFETRRLGAAFFFAFPCSTPMRWRDKRHA